MPRDRIPRWAANSVAGRPLVAERLADGRWLLLTRVGLVIATEDGTAERHAWTEVERAEWDGESHALTVHWIGGRAPEHLVTSAERPRELPLTFRERVDASIVHSESQPARGGGSLRAIVRRSADGELFTQVLGVGRVRSSPALDEQINALETAVRRAVGLR